ncbi:unnamed protein product [Mucor fragilis]
MSRVIDALVAEMTKVSGTLALGSSGEACAKAMADVKDLKQMIQDLVATRESLLSAMTTANNRSVVSSASSVNAAQSTKSSRTLFGFPNNLPAFQWVGMKEFDSRSPAFDTVDDYLLKFEDVMYVYELDFDKACARLVPPMLSTEQRTWYASFTAAAKSPVSWDDFKAAVKARYGISVVGERQHCANELMNIRILPDEQVKVFIDRFIELRRRAKDQAPSDHLLVQPFLNALPWALKYKIDTIRQSQGIIGQRDIDVIAGIAREALLTMSASELDLESAPTFARTAAGSAGYKWYE